MEGRGVAEVTATAVAEMGGEERREEQASS